MKRLHVHVAVNDLAASVRFYTTLFGTEPSVTKDDYAKWMLDDPQVNFAISARGRTAGLDHLGIQAEDESELAATVARLTQTEAPVLDQAETVCCYARLQKAWVHDPQGIAWETFLTRSESTTYGEQPAFTGAASSCCAPSTAPVRIEPIGGCCTPKSGYC